MRTTLVGILIAAAASEVSRSDRLRSDVIASWNLLAHDLAFAEDQFLTFKGQRALAMMHLAMHDAVNAIVPNLRDLRLPSWRHSARAPDRSDIAGRSRRADRAVSRPADEDR
jgi:hypothetical protein